MKTLKILALSVTMIFLSFKDLDESKIQLTNSNIVLNVNEFKLKKGTTLLNKSDFENLYVTIDIKRVNGKIIDSKTGQKIRIKGTKYNLNFYEKCNQKGTKLQKEKTFVTIWDNGNIDKWNTEKTFKLDEYQFEIRVTK